MAEEDESRKGQNLEMIVSKLAKEKPGNGLGNLILISGVNIQNLTFPDDTEDSGEECDPDLHQCGKCKQMFSNLEKYLQHRASKSCRKKQSESQDVTSDDGGSPSQVPEVVQMEAPGNSNIPENESPDQLELGNKRKHDRKGVARKRTNLMPEPMTSIITSTDHPGARITMDGVPEIIRPTYTSTPTFTSMGAYRTTYEHAAIPNNNDLYALMELTKNSGIKEVPHGDENIPTSRPRELLNGGIHPIFHHSPLNSPPNHRFPTPLALRNHIPPLPPNHEGVHHQEPMHHPESVLVSFSGVENPDANQKGAKRRYKCDKCDRDFNQRANLRRHQLVHSGEKPFECEQCHRRFQQQGDLKRHMLRHAETTWYHCQPCDRRFMRVDRWKAHMKSHEEDGTLPPDVGNSMVEMSNGPTEQTGEGEPEKPIGSHHICSKCNQTFMEPDELLVHTCADGNIRVTAVSMETQDGVDLEPEVAVKMAERFARTVAADSDHSRAYSSSRSTRGKLTNPHKCPLCNAHYKNEDSLKTHILKHSGEKKYKCDQCPKAFFTSSNLKIHRRIHSGDKPLKCKVCFKAFSDPSNFNKHKKSHIKGKIEPRGPTKKGRNSKRDMKEEYPGMSETLVEAVGKEGEVMQFGSPSREFLQSQYEALLPALEDGRAEGKEDGAGGEETDYSEDPMKFSVPFIESPSY